MSLPSILLVQEKGRHPANWQFRECENFRRSFERLGVTCEVWGLGYDTFTTSFDTFAAPYDVVFVIENYDQKRWVPDLSACRKLKVFWSIDSHCALKKHMAFASRSRCQIHLNSTESYLPHFAALADTCRWFPNAYPDDLIERRAEVGKTHDVGFCGSVIGDRAAWLAAIERTLPVAKDVFVIGDAMVRAVNGYRIGLNQTIADDLNYRIFETLGCGTCLLTNRVPGLDRLFTPGRDLAVYGSVDELIDHVRYYLTHADERERMAAAGYAHVRRAHTYDVRARQFLEIVSAEVRR